MAKRELSNTLKNLKFMQRAIQREDKSKVEQEVKAEGSSVFQTNQRRKCLVIMEGNPSPGAVRGRMSFHGFNPSIDKPNEEVDASTTSASNQTERLSNRDGGSLEGRYQDLSDSEMKGDSDGDHKRKHMMVETDRQNPQSPESSQNDGQPSSRKGKGRPRKKQRRDKLWNVLRPPSKPNSM